MAREHARVKFSIWEDDDFRALSADQQHLYFVLLTSPKLDYAGVTDWRPARISPLVADWTPERVEQAAQVLSEQRYIAIDVASEEVLLRSFIRHDGLLDSPNMAVAMRKAHAAIASTALRSIIVFELGRLHKDKPDMRGWPNVSELLDKASLDPSEYPSFQASPNPSLNPSGNPSVNPSVSPSDNGDPIPSPTPSGNPSPTTATAPNSRYSSENPLDSQVDTARKRAHRLPDEWKPTEADVTWQREQGIDDLFARREFEKFTDHWRAEGSRTAVKLDWSAAWRNWLRKAREWQRPTPGATPTGTDVPDWMRGGQA